MPSRRRQTASRGKRNDRGQSQRKRRRDEIRCECENLEARRLLDAGSGTGFGQASGWSTGSYHGYNYTGGQSAPIDVNGCNTSENPVRYFDGQANVVATDLQASGFGAPWAHTRTWAPYQNTLAGTVDEHWPPHGNHWELAEMRLVQVGPTAVMALDTGLQQRYFDWDGNRWVSRAHQQGRLNYTPAPGLAIESLSRLNNVVTVTTSTTHGYVTGSHVWIVGTSDASFEGRFQITSTGPTTFTYAQTAANASATGGVAATAPGYFTMILPDGGRTRYHDFLHPLRGLRGRFMDYVHPGGSVTTGYYYSSSDSGQRGYSLDRLKEVQRLDGASGAKESFYYRYDSAGRISELQWTQRPDASSRETTLRRVLYTYYAFQPSGYQENGGGEGDLKMVQTIVPRDEWPVVSLTRSGTTATATTSAPHGYQTNDKIVISGASDSGFNGTFQITATSATTFTYTVSSGIGTSTTGAVAQRALTTLTRSGTTATATTAAAHGHQTGDTVVIANASDSGFNGTFQVVVTGNNTFQYSVPSSIGASAAGAIVDRPTDVTYYRYWQATHYPSGHAGFDDGLPAGDTGIYGAIQMVFGPQAVARLEAAFPHDMAEPLYTGYLNMTDGAVLGYADNYYSYLKYDGPHIDKWRVVKEIARGEGCSCFSNGGSGRFLYQYPTHTSENKLTPPATPNTELRDYNAWRHKVVEIVPDSEDDYLPDNDRTVIYLNEVGDPMLKVYLEGQEKGYSGPMWYEYFRYDNNGRLVMKAHSSAILTPAPTTDADGHLYPLGAFEQYTDLLHYSDRTDDNAINGDFEFLADNAGLIETYNYSGWAFDERSGIAANGTTIVGTSLANRSAPGGEQVAFVKDGGTASLNVAGWAAGKYKINYKAASTTDLVGTLKVYVDGDLIDTRDASTSSGPLTRNFPGSAFSTQEFVVSAGDHTILFEGGALGNTDTICIDDVSITLVQGVGVPAVESGVLDFEKPDLGTGATAYRYNPTDYAISASEGTPGSVAGQLRDTKVQHGERGAPVVQSARTYYERTAGGISVHPIAEDKVYTNEDGTGEQATKFTYQWYEGTTLPISRAAHYPTVGTASNGPGPGAAPNLGPDVERVVYDRYGRIVWSIDGDAYVNRFSYDLVSGAVSSAVADHDDPYLANVLSDGPAGYWRFGDSGTTTAAEEVYGRTLTYQGGYTLGSGGALVGDGSTAAGFNGTTGYGDGGSGADGLRDVGDVTLEAWIFIDALPTTGGHAYLLSRGGGTGETEEENFDWALGIANVSGNGRLFAYHESGVGADTLVTDAANVSTGAWHHVTVVRDGGAKTYTFYLDGTGGTSISYASNPTGANAANVGTDVGRRAGGGNFFNGKVDEAAVYRYALASDRVLAHHAAGRGAVAQRTGLELTTVTTSDGLGRTTMLTDPAGNTTYTVYNDHQHEARTYRGWVTGTSTPTGPIEVVREHRPDGGRNTATASGMATGGSQTTLVDTNRSEATGYFDGYHLTITSGSGAGQSATVVAYNGTTKTFTLSLPFDTFPDSTSEYLLVPPAIDSFVYFESLTSSAAPSPGGGSPPNGKEAIDTANILSMRREFTNRGNQVIAVDDYVSIGGLLYDGGRVRADSGTGLPLDLGTPSVHYNRTEYGFDNRGRQNRLKAATGTITRTGYDGRGRIETTWIGTSDTPSNSGKYFDFGGGTAYVEGSITYTQVRYNTAYNYDGTAGSRYGWQTTLTSGDEKSGSGNNLLNDAVVAADMTFEVDVPAGDYTVTVWVGDPSQGRDGQAVYLEGRLAYYYSTSHDPEVPAAPVAWQIATGTGVSDFTWPVTVTDGRLTVRLKDTDSFSIGAGIAGLKVIPRPYWSPTNYVGTNTVKVSENQYDNGGAGDGNLTATAHYPGEPAGSAPAVNGPSADATSKGDWKGNVGFDGRIIAGDASDDPTYGGFRVTIGGTDATATTWASLPSNPDADTRFLHERDGYGRSTKYWSASGTITVDLGIADALPHRVALYFLNFDDDQSRSQTVKIVQKNSSGTVLSQQTIAGTDTEFRDGKWLIWNVRGDVRVEVSNNSGSPGAVLSGVFLDPGTVDPSTSPAAPTATRVDRMYYDWRNRLVVSKSAHQGSILEDTAAQRRLYYRELDNLGRVVQSYQYDGDALRVTTTNGVPDKPSASALRGLSRYDYDERGRLFRTSIFSINPISGGDPTSGLTSSQIAALPALRSHTWYNRRGQVAKTQEPGGLVQKSQYDVAGRPVTSYASDGGGDSTWADSLTVDGDTVLEQTETQYDAAGNASFTIRRQRFHDTSGTGALGGPGDATKAARVSYSGAWYDKANRITDSVDWGTNAGSAMTQRPTSQPGRSDTVLVTSYGYKADEVQKVIVAGGPTGGSFTLSFNNQTTSAISYPAAASAVKAALEGLAGLDPGDVAVVGPIADGTTKYYLVRFVGAAKGEINVAHMTANGSALTGGTNAAVTVVTTSEGGDSGRRQKVTDPKAIVAKMDYDATGRTVRVVEAYGDFDPGTADDRITEYEYDGNGNQLKMRAVLPDGSDSGTDPDRQTTQYVYGVTTAGGSKINSNDLLAEVRYPDTTSGEPGTAATDKQAFAYNALGERIKFTDQNQTTHEYDYDLVGRQVRDRVTALGTGTDGLGTNVDGGVRRLETVYDSAGQIQLLGSYGQALSVSSITRSSSVATVTTSAAHGYSNGDTVVIAGANQSEYNGTFVITNVTSTTFAYAVTGTPASPATGTVNTTKFWNQVRREYNGLGQMTADYQSHFGPVATATTPAVRYAYSEMAGGANHSRRTSVTYPDGRVLRHEYNSGVDDAVSRLSYLADGVGTAVGTRLEEYSYLGLGSIVERLRPEPDTKLTYVKQGVEANGVAGDKYAGLDHFGRVLDQRWRKGSSTESDRFVYTYDRNSNRASKDVTATGAPADVDEAYFYDNLDRLTKVNRGTLSSGTISDGSADFTQSWTLDGLGNWDAFATDSDGAGAGGATTQDRTHNARNEITGGAGSSAPIHDYNGNMTRDETGKRYVYDAWNRLAKVDANADGDFVDAGDVTYQSDPVNRRIIEDPNPGAARDLYYSDQWQVLEEREGGAVIYQNVWGEGYVDALVSRDSYSPAAIVDTSFDGDGKLVTQVGSNTADVAYAVAAYPGGKILLGGTSGNKYALVRYNADGSLDTSFDGDGKLVGASSGAGFYDVAVQPDGKIVAVGYSGGDFLVIRLTSTGSLDTSFSGDGIFTESFGGAGDAAYGVAFEYSQSATSPRIVVAGVAGILYGSTSDFAVLRLNADGTIDTTFSPGGPEGDGKATADIAGNADAASDVAVDSAGKVVVVGTARLLSPTRDRMAVARFNANGSLDTSFSGDGKIDVNTGSDWGEGHAVALTGDGKIVVGGAISETTDIFYRRFGLVRLNGDGTMDSSFDTDGIVRSSNFASSVWGDSEDIDYDIAALGDGRIVAAGSTEFVDNIGNPVASFAVARYNVNGSPDTTFDGDGKLTANFGSSTTDYGRAVAVLPGGRVLVAGESNGDFALLRLGKRLYAQQDANWNVTSITHAAGAVVERYLYDPYGAVKILNGAADKDAGIFDWSVDQTPSSVSPASDWDWVYLHQGGRQDNATGDVHFRNRDYDVNLGRWKRSDPIGYVDGSNMYLAYLARPHSLLDPLGTEVVFEVAATKVKAEVQALWETVLAEAPPELRNALDRIIKSDKKVTLKFGYSLKSAHGGSWNTGVTDVVDLRKWGNLRPGESQGRVRESILLHEVVEQAQKQIFGVNDFEIAHQAALRAEEQLLRAKFVEELETAEGHKSVWETEDGRWEQRVIIKDRQVQRVLDTVLMSLFTGFGAVEICAPVA